MNNLKYIKPTSTTETVAEFLARGGEVKRFETRKHVAHSPYAVKAPAEAVNMSVLPMALKIKYGIKG
jgi:hypothetical protein